MLLLCVNMGQPLSSTKKNRRKPHKLFTSQFFLNGNNNLSHTFAVFDDEPIVDLININSASENELLKVREIDLELAKNIIKHRKTIGYYEKVEDLVVVPGMGAERLNRIRHQVCAISKNVLRSHSQSFDSLKSADSRTTTTKSKKLVNINKASIFELQMVHGITQEVAAAIVYYRNKKGPFRRIEDLRKTKYIDHIRLDNIRRLLTVYDDEYVPYEVESEYHFYDVSRNGCVGVNGGSTNGMPDSILADIFELLSAYSPRPLIKEVFRYFRNEKSAFRVSSWNLEDFSSEKASNAGVREVICRTILENGWSILAVQSVKNENALKIICDELNKPRLQRVEEWKNNSHRWQYKTMDTMNVNIGFIYDTGGVDDIKFISSEKGPPELDEFCDNMTGNFLIGNTKLQVLNLKIKLTLSVAEVQNTLLKLMNSEDNCLICGEFGLLLNQPDFFTNIRNFKRLLPVNTVNHTMTNFTKHCTSNFLINESLQAHITGVQGVVKQGLTHLAIPCGWSWGGPVSPHHPIWVEFFVNSELNL